MREIIKKSCVKELVDSLTVVRKDHLEKFTDARLDHRWIKWMVRLFKDSVDRIKKILGDDK